MLRACHLHSRCRGLCVRVRWSGLAAACRLPPPPPPGLPAPAPPGRPAAAAAASPCARPRAPRLPGRRALGRAAAAGRRATPGPTAGGAGPAAAAAARAASEQKGARQRGRGRPVGEGRIRGEGRREREAPQPAGADARPAPTPRLREEPRGPAKSRPYGAAGLQLRPGERGGGGEGMEGGLLFFQTTFRALTQSFPWPQAATYSSGRKQGLAKDG